MKESSKTILEFDLNSVDSFNDLKKALKPSSGGDPSNRDVFLLAMAYGYKHGAAASEVKRSGTGTRVQYIKPEDQALMAAVQIGHDKSTENIANLERRYELAELYAQGGILLLKESITEAVKYGNELAAEIVSLLPSVEPQED